MLSILIDFSFSVISNINGTVSITPMENAKTFVNGNLVSEATILHHVREMRPTMKSQTCCITFRSDCWRYQCLSASVFIYVYSDLLRVTEWFLEAITISASTTRPRCNVERECPVGVMEMARRTLSLPRMSYFQLKELSEFIPPPCLSVLIFISFHFKILYYF